MSFVAPLFLLGLLALTVPWLLHRLNQHDAKVQDFPSDQFLEATTAVSARRKNLRYLKLLALRLLFIALLCLLFAQPVINKLGELLGEVDWLHVIVLDTSFSMQTKERSSDARDAVEALLDELPIGSRIQLLSAASALTEETSITLDKDVIRMAVAAVKPGFQRLRYGEMMRQLSALAAEATMPLDVHIVSDMQASAVPARASDLVNRDFATVRLHDVSQDDVGNRALRLKIKPLDQKKFDLLVEIHRFPGTIAVKASTTDGDATPSLELYRSGELVATQELEPNIADTVLVSFDNLAWPALSAIEHYEVRLTPGDSLSADDKESIAVRREPEMPIAIVSNASTRERRNSADELFLRTALELDPRNRVSTHAADVSAIPTDTRLLIYLDHVTLKTDQLPSLPTALTQLMDDGVPLLYVLSATSTKLPVPSEIGFAAHSHPLELNLAEWEEVRFYAHQPLNLVGSQTALLSTDSGLPVLVEQSSLQVKFLWLNAALNGGDNNVPTSPVFVPFLRDVIDYFVRSDAYPEQLQVGEGLRLKKSVQLLDPQGKPMLGLAERGKEKTQLLTLPGVYTLFESDLEFPIRVVVDLAESDSRKADSADIERWQSGAADIETTNTSSRRQGAVTQPDTGKKTEAGSSTGAPVLESRDEPEANLTSFSLTHWLLPACLLLLLLESLYANWHLRTRRTS